MPKLNMKIFPIVSLGLYVVACCIPSLQFNQTVYSGIGVLAFGWWGVLRGVFAWCANPIWLLALVMAFLGKTRVSTIAGGLALVLGLQTFLLLGKTFPSEYAGDVSGNNMAYLQGILPGAYVWLASLLVLPLAPFISIAK